MVVLGRFHQGESKLNDLVEALERIKQERKLNDKELARLIGIDQSTLSKILSEERGVGMEVAKKMYETIPELLGILFPRRRE